MTDPPLHAKSALHHHAASLGKDQHAGLTYIGVHLRLCRTFLLAISAKTPWLAYLEGVSA